LLAILVKLDFHPVWINWIHICITSSSFSILINDSSFCLFTLARGLQLGDPLSPFLFILGIEVLSRLFQMNKSIGLLSGIKIAKKKDFQDIIDKVLHRVEGWKAKSLSQVGRPVLIKSVVATIPSYAMNTFMLPIFINATLDKIFKDFWWGFPKGKNRNLSLKS
jgi:hypothetical protein